MSYVFIVALFISILAFIMVWGKLRAAPHSVMAGSRGYHSQGGPLIRTEAAGEEIQQFRVARQFSAAAKVIYCAHDTLTGEVIPDPIC